MSILSNILNGTKHIFSIEDERWAIEIAAQYDLVREYYKARREGLSPEEALEEWDLI